ncbi:putative transcription factor C2H2 family [Medicago truncatula]|nr:E3 ubiquitin ligase BIG BROTHER-related [Medicago truncatula]RHN69436.1 putative transcription factor C2H2 family [Medicago truncatula]
MFISSNTSRVVFYSHSLNRIVIPFFSSSMEREEGKQSSEKNPYTELEEVSSDFVLAIGLQEQELERTTFTNLATIESESDEDISDSSFSNDDIGDADFSFSQEFETDLQFVEDEGSNIDDDDDYEDDEMELEEDEVDPDELSYEELIELGNFIGEEKRGLPANEISSCLHPYTSKIAESTSGIDRCVICQIEYEEGESLVALHCDHPYHTDCISKWLQIKKVCPICSNEVSTTNKAKNT